jgi:S1-C subfamily serine protease
MDSDDKPKSGHALLGGGIMKIARITLLFVALIIAWAVPSEGKELREVFKKVNSSVVVVKAIQTDVIAAPQTQLAIGSAQGSGVLISKDGEVMTAAHLVQTANQIFVEFPDGDFATARIIASEPAGDVALLKLNSPPPSGATVAKLGDSDQVEVGDQIFIIGAPHGIDSTLTVGYISAHRRPNTVYNGSSFADFFQTDAAINQGNSGGPMFNMAGEIVGIVSHIISKSGGSEGMGFVVTSNMARRLLFERRSFWSGISGYFISKDFSRVFNVPPPGVGMLVQRVATDSPAAQVGLQGGTVRATIAGENLVLGGDVILEVEGMPFGVENYQKIQELMSRLGPSDSIEVKILRGGEQQTLTGQLMLLKGEGQ